MVNAWKKIITLVLCSSIVLAIPVLMGGCNENMGVSGQAAYISQRDNSFILANGVICVEMNAETGYIGKIQNLITGTVNKESGTDAFPFVLDYTYNRLKVAISQDTKNRVSSVKMYQQGDVSYMDVTYDNLVTQRDGAKTGISAVVHYALGKDDAYFKVSLSLDMAEAKDDVYGVRFFEGTSFSTEGEMQLTAPTWNGGSTWISPLSNSAFKDQKYLGYPGKDAQTLECGWVDLHNGSEGVGIALINRSMCATEFRFSAGDTGMELLWAFLDGKNITGTRVPLTKGDKLDMDTLLVAAHSGDWHTMADIYREEYQTAFVDEQGNPLYLTEETLSQKVKNADYMIRYFAGMDGALVTTFADMYTQSVAFFEKNQADPARCIVWIAGQNEKGYAFDVPLMTPTYPAAGGDAGLLELDEKLHALGATVFHYEHPFAVDPDGAGYFKETDPFQHTEHWNLCTHHSVCIDNNIMQNLWKDTIIPGIRGLKADGVQFDQAPLQQTICNLPGHNHGDSAVERLSSHAKAIAQLEQMVRQNLSEDAFIVSEGASDILCRYIDVRQECWHVRPLWDGDYEFFASQYTFPQYAVQSSSVSIAREGYSENRMLLGAISGSITCISDGAEAGIAAEFARFKADIRQANAPGFPYGFRDNVGITVNNEKIIVKVFTSDEGVTLTYTTPGTVHDVVISVDLEALGFSGAGVREIKIDTLKRNTCGFQVIPLEVA